MRNSLVLLALALALAAVTVPARAVPRLAGAAPSALVPVANARNPYGNVDRRNDAGNDTGDAQTDRLNTMQLDQNYRGGNDAAPMQAPPPGRRPGY